MKLNESPRVTQGVLVSIVEVGIYPEPKTLSLILYSSSYRWYIVTATMHPGHDVFQEPGDDVIAHAQCASPSTHSTRSSRGHAKTKREDAPAGHRGRRSTLHRRRVTPHTQMNIPRHGAQR